MFVLADVPKDILKILDDVIKEKELSPLNGDLAGNIMHEYSIPKGKAAVSPMLMHMIVKHREKYPNYFKKAHSTLNYRACEIELFNLWVNFQKKHEFNPMHVHRGVFSFVLFMKIPYDLEQEDKVFPDTVNPGKFEGYHDDLRTSRFVFVNPDPLYGMKQIPLHVDKSFEGKGCLFRSLQNHMVYPFYTSDETRVTVSGNIVIHV